MERQLDPLTRGDPMGPLRWMTCSGAARLAQRLRAAGHPVSERTVTSLLHEFCHITESWRGRSLVSHEVVVNLIGATTTKGGLAMRSERDEGRI